MSRPTLSAAFLSAAFLSAAFLSALREKVPDVVATGLTLRSATHGTVRFTSGNSFASVPMWGGNSKLFEVVTEVAKQHGALKDMQ